MKRTVLFLCAWLVWCAGQLNAQRQKIDLQGNWAFRLDAEGTGIGKEFPMLPFSETISLPGTTDTNRKGTPNNKKEETTYLSRLTPYVGKAWYRRTVEIPETWKGKVITLLLERTKPTKVWVDGKPAGENDDISTPQQYDLSGWLTPGRHELTVMVDNGKSVPQEVINSSHAYSESTQTNWNGIIGDLYLEAKEPLHIADVQLYPDVATKSVRVHLSLENAHRISRQTEVVLAAESWNTPSPHKVAPVAFRLKKGQATYQFDYPLGDNAQLWSEFSPALYRLDIEIKGCDKVSSDFGLREFKAQGTQFAINGTTTFLRGKHDACVFPLTGHTAMDVKTWRHYFRVAKSYGINHYRFHSWCPPRACFEAADIEGIYLQPELPFWGWFGKENKRLIDFLRKEGVNMQRTYGNHASFVMFALGNELSGDVDTMKSLLADFRAVDNRHLYAYGSNNHLGNRGFITGQDFLVTCRIGADVGQSFKTHTRGSFSFADTYDGGYINHCYPNTVMNFREAIKECPVPVVSHETGQFQVYPNYREIEKYTGVLYPYNMETFRHRLAQVGMLSQADDFFHASGKWAVELYKADIEMDLRTPGFAGFQLLDLQDYPGQGSAYVGILDAFMDSKGLVTPERWRGFCCETVPLLIADKFCWSSDEPLRADVKIAHYAPCSLKGKRLVWELKDEKGGIVVDRGSMLVGTETIGLIEVGSITPNIASVQGARRLDLSLAIEGTPYRNSYALWVYPAGNVLKQSEEITVTRDLDETAIARLQSGGKVLWFPKREAYREQTVGGLFQTDYWNYRMFETISKNNKKPVSPGTLGILTDPKHPLFNSFPTGCHTNWQWFSIIKASYPLIMDMFPQACRPIVQVIDNIERNHKLGLVFELGIDKGKLLVCMADLESAKEKPEVRQFYNSMIEYMLSDAFQPMQKLGIQDLRNLLHAKTVSKAIDELKNISYE